MDAALIDALTKFTGGGLAGAGFVIVVVAYFRKDRELSAQAQEFRGILISMQRELMTGLHKMAELADAMEKRDEKREQEYQRLLQNQNANARGGPYR